MPVEHYQRIFLLSHMRAYTSLLGHILGSHPMINGYFEMHIGYQDASALDTQLAAYRGHETLKEGSRFLFDKLLHNDYPFRPERLGSEKITILLALREPQQSIKSMVNLFAQKTTPGSYAQPRQAARYYVERLNWLSDFCRTTGVGYYYFDAALLKTEPERLLPALAGWLQLDSPLHEDYQRFSQTGKSRKGDSSPQIHSGKIDRSSIEYPHIEIAQPELEKALSSYDKCRRQIIRHALDSATF